jgi:hypothetical protein
MGAPPVDSMRCQHPPHAPMINLGVCTQGLIGTVRARHGPPAVHSVPILRLVPPIRLARAQEMLIVLKRVSAIGTTHGACAIQAKGAGKGCGVALFERTGREPNCAGFYQAHSGWFAGKALSGACAVSRKPELPLIIDFYNGRCSDSSLCCRRFGASLRCKIRRTRCCPILASPRCAAARRSPRAAADSHSDRAGCLSRRHAMRHGLAALSKRLVLIRAASFRRRRDSLRLRKSPDSRALDGRRPRVAAGHLPAGRPPRPSAEAGKDRDLSGATCGQPVGKHGL